MNTAPTRPSIYRKRASSTSVTACVSLERSITERDSAIRSLQRSISPKSLNSKIFIRKLLTIPIKKSAIDNSSCQKKAERNSEPAANSILDLEAQLKASPMFIKLKKKTSTTNMNISDSQSEIMPRLWTTSGLKKPGDWELTSMAQMQATVGKSRCPKKSKHANGLEVSESLYGFSKVTDTTLRINKVTTFEEFKQSIRRNSVKECSVKPILKLRKQIGDPITNPFCNIHISVKNETKSNSVKFSKQVIYYRFNPDAVQA